MKYVINLNSLATEAENSSYYQEIKQGFVDCEEFLLFGKQVKFLIKL